MESKKEFKMQHEWIKDLKRNSALKKGTQKKCFQYQTAQGMNEKTGVLKINYFVSL